MNYDEFSPLLERENMFNIVKALKAGDESYIYDNIHELEIEKSIHILRFFEYKGFLNEKESSIIYNIWRRLLPIVHQYDSEEARHALLVMSQWWPENIFPHNPDQANEFLNKLGIDAQGLSYFRWIALHPMTLMDGVRDDYRRGAIICLGRYACMQSENFLARHLDDWINIQIDVVYMLMACHSKLLLDIQTWYKENDVSLRDILSEYFN